MSMKEINGPGNFSLMLLALACIGCSSTPTSVADEDGLPTRSETVAALPRLEVSLKEGETALYDAQGITVTYVRLVGDSRCPLEGICIWAGDAEALLRFRQDSSELEVSLHPNGLMGPRRFVFGGWALELVRLDPYPSTNVTLDLAASRVVLLLVPVEG